MGIQNDPVLALESGLTNFIIFTRQKNCQPRKPAVSGPFASPVYMDLDVVVIDDDAVVLFLHKVLIQRSKLPSTVRDFADAEAALEYISGRKPAAPLLIFLDINMPGCNGWDFLNKIDHLPYSEEIFVIMVTSSINESDRKKAEEYSRVIDYREKPLSRQACDEIYIKLCSLL